MDPEQDNVNTATLEDSATQVADEQPEGDLDAELGGDSQEFDAGGEPAPDAGVAEADPDGSLTTGESDPQSVQPERPAHPAGYIPEGDYRNLQSYADRQIHQFRTQLQQQAQELEQLRQFRLQQQQQAEQARIPKWSRVHPEYQKFAAVKEKARAVNEQLRNIPPELPPEAREAAQQAIMAIMSPEDRQLYHEYRQDAARRAEQFHEDPESVMLPVIQHAFNQMFEDRARQWQADQRVAQEFQDPELAPVIQQHGPEMRKALQDGVPYDYAVHMARMFARLEQTTRELSALRGQEAQVSERDRLQRGRATTERTPTPPRRVRDPYAAAKAEALERGIPTDSPQFFDLLIKHEQSH